mgnify:CR=1 FL=1
MDICVRCKIHSGTLGIRLLRNIDHKCRVCLVFDASIPGTREPSCPVSNGWPCSVSWPFLANVYQDNTCASGIRLVPLELHCLCASLRRGLAHSGLYIGWLAGLIEAELSWSCFWVQRLSLIQSCSLCCVTSPPWFIWCCVIMADLSQNTDKHDFGFVNGRGSKIAWDLRSDWSLAETSCSPALPRIRRRL